MYILLAVILVIAAVACFAVPDPLPFVEEIILVAGSLFTFYKGIGGKKKKTPDDYIEEDKKKMSEDDDDETVYVYKPPEKKSKTPEGYPKYDKNNPDAVYYYKK